MLPQKCMTPTEPVREVPPESGEPVAPAADTDGSVQHADGETSAAVTPSATDTGQGAAQHADGKTAAPQTLAAADTSQLEPDPRVKGYKFLPVEPSGDDETIELSEGHQKLIKALVEHIGSKDPFPVIGLEGAWGSGKSTILARVIDQLRETALASIGAERPLVVTFNAWTHRNDLALRALVEAVVAAAEDAPEEAKQALAAAEEAAAKEAAVNEAAATKAADTAVALSVKKVTMVAEAVAQRCQGAPAPAEAPAGQDENTSSDETPSNGNGSTVDAIGDRGSVPGADNVPVKATAKVQRVRTVKETLGLTKVLVEVYSRPALAGAITTATRTGASLRTVTQTTTRSASQEAEGLAIAAACVPAGAALVSVAGENVVFCWPNVPDCLPHVWFLVGMTLLLLPLTTYAFQRYRGRGSKNRRNPLSYKEIEVTAGGTEPTTIEAETAWRECISALTIKGAFTRIVLVLDDIDRLEASQLEGLWPVLTFLLGSQQQSGGMQGKLVAVVPFDRKHLVVRRAEKSAEATESPKVNTESSKLSDEGWLARLLPVRYRMPANLPGYRLAAMPSLLARALPSLTADDCEAVREVWSRVTRVDLYDGKERAPATYNPRDCRGFVNTLVASLLTAPERVPARLHAIHAYCSGNDAYEHSLAYASFEHIPSCSRLPMLRGDWGTLRNLYFGCEGSAGNAFALQLRIHHVIVGAYKRSTVVKQNIGTLKNSGPSAPFEHFVTGTQNDAVNVILRQLDFRSVHTWLQNEVASASNKVLELQLISELAAALIETKPDPFQPHATALLFDLVANVLSTSQQLFDLASQRLSWFFTCLLGAKDSDQTAVDWTQLYLVLNMSEFALKAAKASGEPTSVQIDTVYMCARLWSVAWSVERLLASRDTSDPSQLDRSVAQSGSSRAGGGSDQQAATVVNMHSEKPVRFALYREAYLLGCQQKGVVDSALLVATLARSGFTGHLVPDNEAVELCEALANIYALGATCEQNPDVQQVRWPINDASNWLEIEALFFLRGTNVLLSAHAEGLDACSFDISNQAQLPSALAGTIASYLAGEPPGATGLSRPSQSTPKPWARRPGRDENQGLRDYGMHKVVRWCCVTLLACHHSTDAGGVGPSRMPAHQLLEDEVLRKIGELGAAYALEIREFYEHVASRPSYNADDSVFGVLIDLSARS